MECNVSIFESHFQVQKKLFSRFLYNSDADVTAARAWNAVVEVDSQADCSCIHTWTDGR